METRVRRTTVFKRFSVTRDPPRPWYALILLMLIHQFDMSQSDVWQRVTFIRCRRKVFVNVGKMKLYRWQHARGNKVTPITNVSGVREW